MKRLLTIMLAATFVLGMSACSSNGADNSTDASLNNDTQEEQVQTQTVNKSNLGLTLELSQEYADCLIADMDDNNIKSVADGAIGGFSIIKPMNGTDYVLANVLVLPNSLIDTAEKRGAFPYIFSGANYSVAAKLPMIDSTSPDYETMSNLQSGILNQLVTMFFDEATLTSNISGESTNNSVDNIESGIENTD